jgi:DNA-binding MurR/RpiR family transcriptional regulator
MLVHPMEAERDPDGTAPAPPAVSDDYGLDERVAAATDLSPSERSVAAYCLDHRDQIPFMSVAEIAAGAGVGTASVIRAAQRLGYDGLLKLKRELRGEIQTRQRTTAGPPPDGSEASRLLNAVVDGQIASLEGTLGSMRRSAFDAAVDLLAGADRVVILVGGFPGGLAQYLGRWLRVHGRRVLLVDTPDVADVMVELGTGDVLVVFGFEEISERLLAALDIAGVAAVPVVLITETFALALRDRIEVALTVRTGSTLDHPSGVPIVAVIDALLIGLSEREGVDR